MCSRTYRQDGNLIRFDLYCHQALTIDTESVKTDATRVVLKVSGECLPCTQPTRYREFLQTYFLITFQSGPWLEGTLLLKPKLYFMYSFLKMGGLQPVGYMAPGSGDSLTHRNFSQLKNYVQIMNTGS